MAQLNAPTHADLISADNLDPNRLPRHLAVIMDGNGRWAVERGRPRIEGHMRGADVVREVVTECARLKLQQLTLYCFSAENWKRPTDEVQFLMKLLQQFLHSERELILEQQIRFRVIGRRSPLPDDILQDIDRLTEETRNNAGLTLCLAINYGGRVEIVDACRAVAERVRQGELDPEQVDETEFARHLYTADMPDPDLLIRTAGEMRISNYLLWQLSYAELWVTPLCWPDFGVNPLHEALVDFANRERRFGGLRPVHGPDQSPDCPSGANDGIFTGPAQP